VIVAVIVIVIVVMAGAGEGVDEEAGVMEVGTGRNERSGTAVGKIEATDGDDCSIPISLSIARAPSQVYHH